MFLTERDFQSVPRLMWSIGKNQDIRAYAKIRGRLRQDYLSFHLPGHVSVYYTRETTDKALKAAKFWRRKFKGWILSNHIKGDNDGVLIFGVKVGCEIPEEFLGKN